MKRLFRARIELHKPWRFWAVIAATAALAAFIAQRLDQAWATPTILAALLALALVLRQVSRYGGQALMALEIAAQELELYSLVKTRQGDRKGSEPAFEE